MAVGHNSVCFPQKWPTEICSHLFFWSPIAVGLRKLSKMARNVVEDPPIDRGVAILSYFIITLHLDTCVRDKKSLPPP